MLTTAKRSPGPLDGPYVQEYKKICNKSKPLDMGMVRTFSSQPELSVFRESTPASMEDAVKDKTATKFIVQHKSDVTEDALDLQLRTRQAMDHVHSVRSKVGYSLMVALRDKLATGLAKVPEAQEAVTNCTSFQAITNLFVTYEKTPALIQRLEKAAKDFCEENGMAYGFWSQSRILDQLNKDRNDVVHCPAADSATALRTAASIEGVDFKGADAIVDALATFAAKHGAELDAAAKVEQELARRAQEEIKQLRSKRGQGLQDKQ